MPSKITKATRSISTTRSESRMTTTKVPRAAATSSPFFKSSKSSSRTIAKKVMKSTGTSTNTRINKSPKPRSSPFSTKIPDHHLQALLAHPVPLIDILAPSLLLVFIGTNPGLLTAYTGHTYSSPTNSFWKLLHASSLTPTSTSIPLPATEDRTIPERFLLGNTNIVERATRNQEGLGKEEMLLGAGRAVKKISQWRPEAVCVVGKGVWEAFVAWEKRCGKNVERSGFGGCPVSGKKFQWGWQMDGEGKEIRMGAVDEKTLEMETKIENNEIPERSWLGEEEKTDLVPPPVYNQPWEGARVYVVPSTSGLVTIPFAQKLEIWKGVGEWVSRRREEKGFICS